VSRRENCFPDTEDFSVPHIDAPSEAVRWEQELAELLSELSDVQQDLLELLAAKRQCMANSQLQDMTQLQPREQELCDRLQACHDRRGQLLDDAARHGLPHGSLEKLASSLRGGKSGQLQKQVKESSSRMRLLQLQSLTNWVLAQRTMLHLAQLLEIVATGGRLQPTYGRSDVPVAGGALVDSDA